MSGRRWSLTVAALIVVGIVCLAMAWSQLGISGAVFTEDAGAPPAAAEQEPEGLSTEGTAWLTGGLAAFVAAGALLTLRRRR